MAVILPSIRLAKEFARLHNRLRLVFNYMLDYCWPDGKDIHVTSIYRSKEEDAQLEGSGIHHSIPHRAIDIRTWPLTDGEVATLTRKMNDRFAYDPDRPKLNVCVTALHGSGPHAHLQSSEYTVERS